jgi:predicted amidophosphoribosyltransferase
VWETLRAHRGCPQCGRGYPIAPACLARHLEPVPADACPRCAQRRFGGRCLSLGCRRGWLCVGTTHAVLGYKKGEIQRLLLAAKDAADRGAVTLLGRVLAGFMMQHPAVPAYDLILPVPFHLSGLRGRPVHPLTAIYLDAVTTMRPRFPVDDLTPPFLVQVRAVPSVRRRTERDRWRAVKGAFALGFRTRMLRGARIAVIDDVMTTGATLSECARVLLEEGGAARVDAIVLVRQPWAHACGRGAAPHGAVTSII